MRASKFKKSDAEQKRRYADGRKTFGQKAFFIVKSEPKSKNRVLAAIKH